MFLVGMVVFLSLWCVWCGVQVLAQVQRRYSLHKGQDEKLGN